MALTLPIQLAPNTVFYVALTNAQCLFMVDRAAEVRYTYEGDSGCWVTGCEFLKPLTNEELRILLA